MYVDVSVHVKISIVCKCVNVSVVGDCVVDGGWVGERVRFCVCNTSGSGGDAIYIWSAYKMPVGYGIYEKFKWKKRNGRAGGLRATCYLLSLSLSLSLTHTHTYV